jgi:hypothetical protein
MKGLDIQIYSGANEVSRVVDLTSGKIEAEEEVK